MADRKPEEDLAALECGSCAEHLTRTLIFQELQVWFNKVLHQVLNYFLLWGRSLILSCQLCDQLVNEVKLIAVDLLTSPNILISA